jgi:hypothetical protein
VPLEEIEALSNMKIGIFVCVCERDMEWMPQFMKQAEILDYKVAWFADKLSFSSLVKLEQWPNTHYIYENKVGTFSEQSKEIAFRGLKGFDWAIQMDIDETWQDGAKELIEKALTENPDGYIAECPMITVFKEGETLYRRIDEYFKNGTESKRWRIYNLKYEWHWNDPITCGGYVYINGRSTNTFTAFPCEAESVHWGYWTHELMEKHKAKWEDVYVKAFGRNPYTHVYQNHINGTVEFEKIPLLEKYYKHL